VEGGIALEIALDNRIDAMEFTFNFFFDRFAAGGEKHLFITVLKSFFGEQYRAGC
jgi:hypothetical protein